MKLNNDGSFTDAKGTRYERLVCEICSNCKELWINATDQYEIVCAGCLAEGKTDDDPKEDDSESVPKVLRRPTGR